MQTITNANFTHRQVKNESGETRANSNWQVVWITRKRKMPKENGGVSSMIAQVPERGEDAEPLTAETRCVQHLALFD